MSESALPKRKPLPTTTLEGLPPELAASTKFEVLCKLGEGGMGAVYKARHTFLNEMVAIKVMNAVSLSNPDARSRFLREMQSVGQLKHKNIVRALDAEEMGELLVLVMEYVEGITLDRLVAQKGTLPVAYSCQCIARAALGLQYAHEKGMVHRDIKPANIIVAMSEKEIKLLDFGLARGTREQKANDNHTQVGVPMGTPAYMAPEQVTDASSVDIRADVYSLGCTLYYLLAGQSPFQRDSATASMMAQVADEARPMTEVRSDVPAGLWMVLAKMLAKKPENRYQTPKEVEQALRQFVTGGAKTEQAVGGKARAKAKMTDAATLLPGNTSELKPVSSPLPSPSRTQPAATPAEKTAAAILSPSVPAAGRGRRKKAKEKKPWLSGKVWVAGVAAAFAAVLIGLWAGGVIRVRTPNGVLVLNVNEPPPHDPAARDPLALDLGGGVTVRFVRVPKGTFWMGWTSDIKQSRQVTIDTDFELGAYTVTQEQWHALMLDNPSEFSRYGMFKDQVANISGADLLRFPVENVSWNDVQVFLRKLNAREDGKGWLYRLPKEAEWEYACRNAATTKEECSFDFYFDRGTNDLSSNQANFNGNFPAGNAAKGPFLGRPTKVGSYTPNKLGLHDMHGNVWEWCGDEIPPRDRQAPLRVIRGGSWIERARFIRTSNRLTWSNPQHNVGLRVARVPVGKENKEATTMPPGTGGKVYLSDLQEFDAKVHMGFFKNGEAYVPGGIKVNGEKFPKGLWTHPFSKGYSSVKYRLDGLNAQALEARVAINDTVRPASPLTFEVRGDDRILWSSKPVQVARQTQVCSVKVQGIVVLELRVACPGHFFAAHAVWLDPYLVTTANTTTAPAAK